MCNPVTIVEGKRYKSLLEQKIKEAAEAKPIDIKALAEKAELSESSLYKIFKAGKARPKTLEKIASILEIEPTELTANSQPDAFTEYKDNLNVPTRSTPAELQVYFSEIPDKDAESYIPYYDVEITAGRIEQIFDEAEEIPEGYIYAPQYRDCIACNVKGDSMYDRIFPGSRLYVYYLKNKKYIDFGHIYLVVLDGYRILKYIDPDPKDESRVVLRSHNREQYKDWTVDKADILHLFLVKGYENQNAN